MRRTRTLQRLDHGRTPTNRVVQVSAVIVVIVLSGFGVVHFARQTAGGGAGSSPPASALALQDGAAPPAAAIRYERLENPARTVVRDGTGSVVATFTDGARTVAVTGPPRTFTEPRFTTASITTTTWVRLAPQEWVAGAEQAEWFAPWFEAARQDTSPDVLDVAMQYVDGAAAEKNAEGLRIRGDAVFGPVAPGGEARLEQSDFFDYLGVSWTFPDAGTKRPKGAHAGALDCSGFVRMVYGYRLGYPLRGTNDAGPGLPRRAYAIADVGPGVALIPNTRTRVTDYNRLQPGDLVFFEVEGGPEILDHTGIYFGIDSDGHHRFMSSRERANGPTFGDLGGTSLLDDNGTYSKAWRAARRI
jgi:cell wall-associated NlpC family hydrolase